MSLIVTEYESPTHFPDQEEVEIVPDAIGRKENHESQDDKDNAVQDKKKPQLQPHRLTKPFRPIILCLGLLLLLSWAPAFAQIQGSLALQATYTDNIFALSDYDLQRFEQDHPYLSFAETSDDLIFQTQIKVLYPLSYRWWLITPEVSAKVSQCISNPEKYRQDSSIGLHLERYYWNAGCSYEYQPHIYSRDYVDGDGTGANEKYSYQRDVYHAFLNIKPVRSINIKLATKHEDYYYNRFWTEFDGSTSAYSLGLRYNLPVFSLDADYQYRVFDNDSPTLGSFNDSSYESDRYSLALALKKMPLSDDKHSEVSLRPRFSLSYEQRFYQGDDSWYGGREDNIYNTTGSLGFFWGRTWNLSLDYSHIFRNVDSTNDTVLKLKEYSENRLSAGIEYLF